MTRKHWVVPALAVMVITLAIGTAAQAEWDDSQRGYGRGMGGGQGWSQGGCPGYGPGAGYGSGGGYGRGKGYGKGRGYGRQHFDANLTDEQRQELDTERQAFHETTQDLRQNIYQKRLELQAEIAKREPDAKKASSLQTEISNLKSQMAQKRLDHVMRV
ncbi:hypothetical protein D3OALGA1CA_5401 [Olavius algarvensis associated proteobacterium Delta 3]|nr:hypothetical protein D3OALGB2SA_1547 [Olavius algarvensis associated proteobacterium Delta 3]CAB5166178.1 hypothetical protein D3OALGA1CA_5401 [Olavius algarvensis associated proteobacterium Delta 3]